jgi:hypothetical protein
MAGEKSKTSGEIGEKLAEGVLRILGWRNKLNNVSIPCNTPTHLNSERKPRQSHGEDVVFLYHNPFHDDRTDVVHISVKNKIDSYPAEQTLRTQFKSHLEELHQTIACARHDSQVHDLAKTFSARKNKVHSGVLIWLHNDDQNIEHDIKPALSKTRLAQVSDVPIYVIDNARAAFLLNIVDHANRTFVNWQFYYPHIGTALKADMSRTGTTLPLELVAADIVPLLVMVGDRNELALYANEPFTTDTYKKLVAYGLHFAGGLVGKIHIGLPDYNAAKDQAEAKQARVAFADRKEDVQPFSFKRSILDFLQE